jgi:hypothetical protein
MGLTFSPDPPHLLAGAGTAAEQAARPQQYAGADGYGWQDTPPVPATGATAGAPGTFSPAGARTPDNLGALASVIATPLTAWTVGQHVVTRDGNEAHWSSTAWVAGRA